MHVNIICITNKDQCSYSMMGPFLARREVEKEIGYQIYDDDDKEWFVALDDCVVVGFCYRQEKSKGAYQIGSCYVIREYRQKGVFKKLLEETMTGMAGNVFLTTNNPVMQDILLKNGFVELGQRGSFTRYGRQI